LPLLMRFSTSSVEDSLILFSAPISSALPHGLLAGEGRLTAALG
jgi:hypothetical protein